MGSSYLEFYFGNHLAWQGHHIEGIQEESDQWLHMWHLSSLETSALILIANPLWNFEFSLILSLFCNTYHLYWGFFCWLSDISHYEIHFCCCFQFLFVKRTCGWYKHGVNLICSTYISTSKLAHLILSNLRAILLQIEKLLYVWNINVTLHYWSNIRGPYLKIFDDFCLQDRKPEPAKPNHYAGLG